MFDTLVSKAQESGSNEDMNTLWKTTFELDAIYFIARGENPNYVPFVGVINDAPMLMGFTDSERAHSFASEANLTTDEGTINLLTFPLKGLIDMASSMLQQGVKAIVINNGEFGYFAPLENIKPMYDYAFPNDQSDSMSAS